ncbi:NAD(P)-dependent oxidoreductase [Mycobacterium sp. NPDC003449]
MSPKLRVGFIGAGRMGRPMCGHIVNGGFQVTVYDPVPEALTAAQKVGAVAAGSAREVAAASDVVIVMPGFYDEVAEAILGEDGLLAGADQGDVIVVASTITPAEAKTLGAQCRLRGVEFLDAPVCQGERGAEEAYLLWMVGGAEDVLQRVRPVLETCGTDIFLLGDIGAGMVGKAINNMLLWAALTADHEALDLAERHAVKTEVLIPALLLSSGTNWPLQKWKDMHRIPWAHKDMLIVLEMADQVGVSVPLAGLLREKVKPLMQAAGISPDLIR